MNRGRFLCTLWSNHPEVMQFLAYVVEVGSWVFALACALVMTGIGMMGLGLVIWACIGIYNLATIMR